MTAITRRTQQTALALSFPHYRAVETNDSWCCWLYSGQHWKIAALGNGYYRLTTLWQGDGLSLDILNDGANNKPYLATTTNASGQFWKITVATTKPPPTPTATATPTAQPGGNGISGRVTADHGAALAGITINAYRYQNGRWRSVASSRS